MRHALSNRCGSRDRADRPGDGRHRSWVWRAGLIAVACVMLVGTVGGRPALGSGPRHPDRSATGAGLTRPKAAVLGVVEGITEFLPVSSTGHLTVVERLLDIGRNPEDRESADSYAIAIQAGAILAVLLLYRRRTISMLSAAAGKDPAGRQVLLALLAAFVPAAALGVAVEPAVKDHLFGPGPVVAAWFVGGVGILIYERARRPSWATTTFRLDELPLRSGVVIGLAQCLSRWPGVSRSLVTLIAGLVVGLEMAAAVEFSFLLGLLTLGAATLYETARHGPEMVRAFGVLNPLLGLAVAFVSAVIAIRWLVTYLTGHSLRIFGWYRIGLAAFVGLLLLANAV